MKVINVTIGTKTINDDGKVISIKGDYNGNGRCYDFPAGKPTISIVG